MPPEYSLLKPNPKVKKGVATRQPTPLDPSWIRTLFEGGVDTALGAIGVGPDSQMNRVGALAGAALPFAKLDKLRLGILGGKAKQMKLNPTEAMDLERLEAGLPFDRSLSVPTSKLSAYVEPTGGRYDKFNLRADDFPRQNKLAMGGSPSTGVYDESGRYIGPSNKVDEAYDAHVASSVGKFTNKKPGHNNLAPDASTVERMMKKFNK